MRTTLEDLMSADTFGAATLFQMKIWSPITDLLVRRHRGPTTREALGDILAASIGCMRMALELGDRLGASREVMREVFEHVMKIHYTPGKQLPANNTEGP